MNIILNKNNGRARFFQIQDRNNEIICEKNTFIEQPLKMTMELS